MQPSKKMDQAAGASQLALVSCKPAVKWFISRDLWMCGIFAILRAPICFRLQRLICCWGVVKCSCKCWLAPPMRSRWICEPIKIQQWERYQTCYLFTVGLLQAFSLFQDCGVGPNNRLCCHISQQHLTFNQLSLLYFVLFPNRPILHCAYKPSINWASKTVPPCIWMFLNIFSNSTQMSECACLILAIGLGREHIDVSLLLHPPSWSGFLVLVEVLTV